MIENLNNSTHTSPGETLPVREEVRIDLHKSNLISLEELKQTREANRLAIEANPQPKVEAEPSTPDERIETRGVYVLMARRSLAAVSEELKRPA